MIRKEKGHRRDQPRTHVVACKECKGWGYEVDYVDGRIVHNDCEPCEGIGYLEQLIEAEKKQ